MTKKLNVIAVDLTPILPGGENGGAKIFVIELLHQLSKFAPETDFILLTQSASHQELSVLDKKNMRRIEVINSAAKNSFRLKLLSLGSKILPHIPNRFRSKLNTLGYELLKSFKKNKSTGILRDINADLLFCPFTAPTFFEMGIPCVSTIYDLQYKDYPEFFSVEDVMHRDHTFQEACNKSAALVAISDFSRESVINHANLDPVQIRTVYLRMARRITNIESNLDDVLRKFNLEKKQYLIFPANFWKHKNHEMLIVAFGIACKNRLAQNIKLVCTGAPSKRLDWLMQAVATMHLSDRIIFPGYVADKELAILIQNSAGMIFPSLYEGFGLPVLEAMSFEVPVACSNTTSLPEIASDAAILFNPRIPTEIADAILRLVEDDVSNLKHVALGKARTLEFSDSFKMAQEYWSVFEFASKRNLYKNQISGNFQDGWLGRCLDIYIEPKENLKEVEIELVAPEWLPNKRLNVQSVFMGKDIGQVINFERGQTVKFIFPLDLKGGHYQVLLSPTIVPSNIGLGEDKRELSVMINHCKIIKKGGDCVELFSKVLS